MLRAMYRYWVVLHILGVASFLLAHGVSMFALYRLRTLDLDRDRIVDTITFSGATSKPMYASLIVLARGRVRRGLPGQVARRLVDLDLGGRARRARPC